MSPYKIGEKVSGKERMHEVAADASWLRVGLLRQGKKCFDQHRSQLKIDKSLHTASAADSEPTEITYDRPGDRLLRSILQARDHIT